MTFEEWYASMEADELDELMETKSMETAYQVIWRAALKEAIRRVDGLGPPFSAEQREWIKQEIKECG